MPLRNYQRDCLRAALADYRAGVRQQAWILPTAAGKTQTVSVLPIMLKQEEGEQMLFTVPLDDLAWQAKRQFENKLGSAYKIGMEKAEYTADPDCDVIIASFQTLAKMSSDGQLERLKRFNPDRIRTIVIDEAHTAMSKSYDAILRYFKLNKMYPDEFDKTKMLVLITATPARSDGVGLENLVDKISYSISLRKLMTTGPIINGRLYPYLCPPKVWRVNTEVDLSQVGSKDGEFIAKQLDLAIDREARNKLILDKYLELGEGLPGVCFTTSVQHSENIAKLFCGAGIAAVAVSGDTPRSKRDELYDLYRKGDIRVLASCQVLGTGWDMPPATVALMGRPCRTSLPYIQSIGRVMRPCPAPEDYAAYIESGGQPFQYKDHCIIIDFCDNTGRHSVMTAPTLFGLPPDFDVEGKDAIETADEVESAMSRRRHLDFSRCKNLRDIKHTVEEVDLWKTPQVSRSTKTLSPFIWQQVRPGVVRLPLKDSSLEIHENLLGSHEIYQNRNGVRVLLTTEPTLSAAIVLADSMVPGDEYPLVNARARWRLDAPSQKQAEVLFKMESSINSRFRSSLDFYEYACQQHMAGNENFSKGGLSLMLDKLIRGAA